MQDYLEIFDKFDLEKLKEPRLEKDRSSRKIWEMVFDKATLLTLYESMRKKYFDRMESIVATGKESHVFYGTRGKSGVAIKLYYVETSKFRNMSKYIKGDSRFRVGHDKRKLVYTWAQKEFRNLSIIYKKVRCPKPIGVLNNILVMEFIGKKGIPAPRLKDQDPKSPKKCFKTIIDSIKKMYALNLVHGDLSEYNVLSYKNEPVIIDISQGVLLSHPLAEELLQRDVDNIVRYFKRFDIEKNSEEVLKYVKG